MSTEYKNDFNKATLNGLVDLFADLKKCGVVAKVIGVPVCRWSRTYKMDAVKTIQLKNGIKMSFYLARQYSAYNYTTQKYGPEQDVEEYVVDVRFDLMSDDVVARATIAGCKETTVFDVNDGLEPVTEYIKKVASVSPNGNTKDFWCEIIRNTCHAVMATGISAEQFFDTIVANAIDYIDEPSGAEIKSVVDTMMKIFDNTGGDFAKQSYERLIRKQRATMRKLAHAVISGEVEI